MRYREKVMQLWNDERRRAAEARRQEVMAAYQKRRLAQHASSQASAVAPDNRATMQIASTSDDVRSRFAPKIQPPSPGTILPRNGHSLRVTSQIPSAADRVQPSPPHLMPSGMRVLPRVGAVPMERRY
jgi:hypothetical protein